MLNSHGLRNISPAFSVVIPLFNKKKWVLETVASVMAQSVQPQEIIVINDGSTDGGNHLVREKFPDVRVVDQRNSGVAEARNLGLKEAACDWVAFLDADDLWHVDHLYELVNLIRECPGARLFSTSWVEVAHSKEKTLIDSQCFERRYVDFFSEAVKRPVVWSSSVAVHRATVLGMGGFRNFKTGEDSELWARMALQWPVARSSRVTATYRRVPGSLMAEAGGVRAYSEKRVIPPKSLADLEKEMLTVAEAWRASAHTVSKDSLRGYLDHLLLRRAKQLLVNGDTQGARGFLSLVNHRSSKRYFVLRVLSLLPGYATFSVLKIKRSLKIFHSSKQGKSR